MGVGEREAAREDNASFFVFAQLWKRPSEVVRISGAIGGIEEDFFARKSLNPRS